MYSKKKRKFYINYLSLVKEKKMVSIFYLLDITFNGIFKLIMQKSDLSMKVIVQYGLSIIHLYINIYIHLFILL